LRIPSRLAHRSGPSGSPDPARLCRGCFHPPRHPQVRLPPASTHGCHGKATTSFTSIRNISLVAQCKGLTGSRVGKRPPTLHILSPISHPPHHVVQQLTLGRRALPLVKAYFPRLRSMPQCPLTGAGAADCSAPVTPTKRVGWSNKRVAAVDIASARFPWIVARVRLSVEHLGIPDSPAALGLTTRGREPHPASATHSGQPHRPVGRRRTTRLP
jgi:hypothetical protein